MDSNGGIQFVISHGTKAKVDLPASAFSTNALFLMYDGRTSGTLFSDVPPSHIRRSVLELKAEAGRSTFALLP